MHIHISHVLVCAISDFIPSSREILTRDDMENYLWGRNLSIYVQDNNVCIRHQIQWAGITSSGSRSLDVWSNTHRGNEKLLLPTPAWSHHCPDQSKAINFLFYLANLSNRFLSRYLCKFSDAGKNMALCAELYIPAFWVLVWGTCSTFNCIHRYIWGWLRSRTQ